MAFVLSTESKDSVKFELFGIFCDTTSQLDVGVESVVRRLLNFKKLLKFRAFLPLRVFDDADDDGAFDAIGLSNFCLTRSKSG